METDTKRPEFILPPHINAEAHKKVMEWLGKVTPEEFLQAMVEAGIYNPDGTLTEPYASEEPSVYRPTD